MIYDGIMSEHANERDGLASKDYHGHTHYPLPTTKSRHPHSPFYPSSNIHYFGLDELYQIGGLHGHTAAGYAATDGNFFFLGKVWIEKKSRPSQQ